MRPTKKTTPDDWAHDNRIYKPSAGRPGPRDPSYTPYVVPFARAFDPAWQLANLGHRYDALALVTSSQAGKTDVVLDVIGWTVDQRPAPVMYVGPNKEFLHKEIEPRLTAMLTGSPRLAEKLAQGKRNNRFRKVVGGVPIGLAWAGSNVSLRGMAAQTAIVDELDAIDPNIQGNGDPFGLLEARGFSFANRIRAAISTPLTGAVDVVVDSVSGLELWRVMDPEDVQSPIWRLWQSGTMHHFCWPCPQCDEFFVPRFKQLRFPEGATPAEAKRTAHLECPRCGGVIEEHHKRDMNARGVYVAPGQTVAPDGTVSGEPPESTTLSMWASGLCSPMVTFGERAASYVTAKNSGEQSKLQSVINTGFGECFAPGGGDVPEWEEVAKCRRPYKKGDVPDGVRIVTMTVDVQTKRLVYVIRGWGHAGTSWLLDLGELYGETTQEKVWNDLALLLKRPVGAFTIRRCFVDSGFRPGKPVNIPVNRVYEFCRRFRGLAYATKGKNYQDRPLIQSRIEVTATGNTKPYGLELMWLDTDWCKSWVHERLRWGTEQPGSWYLPEDVSDGYCKQIVSEARVRKPSGAPEWVPRSRENHYLDCEAMHAALQHSLNLHLLGPAPARAPDAPEPTPPEPTREAARPQSSAPKQSTPAAAQAPPKPPVVAQTTPPKTAARSAPPLPPPSAAKSDPRAERKARLAALTARLYG